MTQRSIAPKLRLFPVLALGALISGASCQSCDGTSGNPNGGGTGSGGGGAGWMVGRQGLMLSIDGAGHMGRYPLQARGDLLAISCWGPSRAWVAGDAGTLLTTEDAGAIWRAVDAGTTTRLRAVEMVQKGHVFVVGDEGLFRVSADSGATWQTVPAPAVTWTAIAPRYDGSGALLTTAAGDIYRYDGNALGRMVVAPAGALDSIALSEDGLVAAAVGAGGAILVSSDGGLRWRDRPSGTTRGLHHVWLIGDDGKSIFAVGDGGTLIDGATLTSDGATPRALGDFTLRGLHLQSSGHGTIVGDGGALFVTTDFGTSWSQVKSDETRDILSVDALGDDHEHW